MHQQPPQVGSPLGKAVALVFLAVWTVTAVGMAMASMNMGSVASAMGMPGPGPGLMAIVPMGFAVIGVLLFIKVAITPSSALPSPTDRADAAPPAPPRSATPNPPTALACPGCGSRKNVPGATTCAYCGGSMASAAS